VRPSEQTRPTRIEGTRRTRPAARRPAAQRKPAWPALAISGGALLLGGAGIVGAVSVANRPATPTDTAVPAATVKEDPFKWDAKIKPRSVVGAKFFVEGDTEDRKRTSVSVGSVAQQDPDVITRTSFRYTAEVLAASDGKASETRFTIERWKQSEGNGDDLCLQGVSVLVKHVGAVRSFSIEDRGVQLTQGAVSWLEGELTKKGKPDPDVLDRALDPPHPLGDGEEWEGDASALFSALGMKPLELDAVKSKIKGKLTNVHVEDGVHAGHVKLAFELAIRSADGQGTGTLSGTLELDRSLEQDKRDQESGSSVIRFDVMRNQKTARGPAVVKFQTDTTTTRRQGPL